MAKQIVYGRTPIGQILYDLAFTDLSAKYLARKHRKPIVEIRRLRTTSSIKRLRRQNGLRVTLAVVVALVASCVTARAATDCMSYSQARAAFPDSYLKYRHTDSGRCWYRSASGSTRALTRHRRVASPKSASASSAKKVSIMFPTLVGGSVEPAFGGLAASAPMSQWPLLIDIDTGETSSSITPNSVNGQDAASTDDFCCWPTLDEPVPFRDRWEALPSNWLATIQRGR